MSPEIRPKSFGTFEKQAPELLTYSLNSSINCQLQFASVLDLIMKLCNVETITVLMHA